MSDQPTAKEAPRQEAILEVIAKAGKPLPPKEIAKRTGLGGDNVRSALRIMKDEGTLAQPGYGLYDLPENVRAEEVTEPKSENYDLEAVRGENGLMYVPLATIRAAAGDGEEPFDRIVERYQAYDRAQLRRDTGVDPERLIMLRVVGNSMRPTLRAGDRVLVARHNGEPIIGEAIYVFHREMRGVVIKRAYWTEKGDLLLKSDNRTDPVDMCITPDDQHEWQVVGRVVKVEKAL